MNNEKIAELIIKAQKGDSSAKNDIVAECYDELYYYILKTVKSEDIAADVTQDTFLEILETLNSLREPKAFALWARRIAYHKSAMYFRKSKEILVEENEDGETIFDEIVDEGEDALPEKVAEDKEFRATILGMINSLPSEQTNALLLYYYEKRSISEIAEIQNASEGTVKSRLNYARKSIKGKVEEYEAKTGTKLHSIAILPILLRFVFDSDKASMPALSVPASVTAAAGAAAVGAGTGAATGATVAGATVAGAGAKAAGGAIAAKIIAGVLAASLAIGGTAFGISKLSGKDDNQSFNEENIPVAEGLEIEYIESDIQGYMVTGIGSFEGTMISFPTEYKGEPVIGIYDNAFINMETLTHIVLPDSYKYIGFGAFDYCEAMKSSIRIPDNCIVGYKAFINCDSLEEVIIGENCYIGEYAFSSCKNLKKVTVGANSELDKYAFSNCESLCEVNLPQAYCSLAFRCFDNCPSLTFVDLDFVCKITDTDEELFVIDENKNIITPHSKIHQTAFDSQVKFNSLSFDLSEVDEEFLKKYEFPVHESIYNLFKTLNLPYGFMVFEDWTFHNTECTINYEGTMAQWQEITWENEYLACKEGATALKINCSDGIFETTSISPHVYENNICTYCGALYQSEGISYILNDKGEALVKDFYTEDSDVYIADTYLGHKVVGTAMVYSNAIIIQGGITSLHFYEGFESFDSEVFAGLCDLTAIYLPSTIKTIGYRAFKSCDNLTDIYYNGTIDDWNKIYFGTQWISYSIHPTVHCTDGDIIVEQ